VLLATALLAPQAGRADGPPVTLSADDAKVLALLGEGVVGKPLPSPPIGRLEDYLNFGAGEWKYQIVHDKKHGKRVRTESYTAHPDADGKEGWKRTIGDEYVEYLRIHPDGSYTKYAEDDEDVDYGARFVPGVVWPSGIKQGEPTKLKSEIQAHKFSKPDHVSYTGRMESTVTYVGSYQVTTPAGTWPAVLIRSEFDIHIGPAKVTDTMYTFFAKGVGKVAEIETLNVSALLVYHTSQKIAKVLEDYPKR
jgi:hypothetical protein